MKNCKNNLKKTAYEIYQELNIAEGDNKIPPARNSRQEVLKILQIYSYGSSFSLSGVLET